MVHFSLHWGLLGILLFAIPFSQIIVRAGFSRWWILAMFIPGINIVLLWIFAYADWPKEQKRDIFPPS